MELLRRRNVATLIAASALAQQTPQSVFAKSQTVMEIEDFTKKASIIAESMMSAKDWQDELGIYAGCETIPEKYVGIRYMMDRRAREIASADLFSALSAQHAGLHPSIIAFLSRTKINPLAFVSAIGASKKLQENDSTLYVPPAIIAQITQHETEGGLNFGQNSLAQQYAAKRTQIQDFLNGIQDADAVGVAKRPESFKCASGGYMGIPQVGLDTLGSIMNQKINPDGTKSHLNPWDLLEGSMCIGKILDAKGWKASPANAFIKYGGNGWYNTTTFGTILNLGKELEMILSVTNNSIWADGESLKS